MNFFAFENLAQNVVGATRAVGCKGGVKFWEADLHYRFFQCVRLARRLRALCRKLARFLIEVEANLKVLQNAFFLVGKHFDEGFFRFLSVGGNGYALSVGQVDGKERFDGNPLDFVQNAVLLEKFA